MAFVVKHKRQLERMPTTFLSVGVGDDEDETLAHVAIDSFVQRTRWHPDRVFLTRRALRYTEYKPIVRFLVKQLAMRAGLPNDEAYANWRPLDALTEEITKSFSSAR
jgi:menaquinone-dependent protoporphyrinogen oxidase